MIAAQLSPLAPAWPVTNGTWLVPLRNWPATALARCKHESAVVRVVVASVRGSSPREAGTSMLVERAAARWHHRWRPSGVVGNRALRAACSRSSSSPSAAAAETHARAATWRNAVAAWCSSGWSAYTSADMPLLDARRGGGNATAAVAVDATLDGTASSDASFASAASMHARIAAPCRLCMLELFDDGHDDACAERLDDAQPHVVAVWRRPCRPGARARARDAAVATDLDRLARRAASGRSCRAARTCSSNDPVATRTRCAARYALRGDDAQPRARLCLVQGRARTRRSGLARPHRLEEQERSLPFAPAAATASRRDRPIAWCAPSASTASTASCRRSSRSQSRHNCCGHCAGIGSPDRAAQRRTPPLTTATTGGGCKSCALAPGSTRMTPRLALHGITKRYPTVVANDGIDLARAPGEIHAVLGENGAGKCTLMKIIYGVTRPDAGTIDGKAAPVDDCAVPRTRARLGIGMVFQHFALFETLTVAENIALALDETRNARRRSRRASAKSRESYGLPVDPQRLVHSMSVGERQRVEIVRCLLQYPRLLIMDEPTSVLTPQAVLKLFETLRRLAAEGCSILYISHKLDEIRALCHTRDGAARRPRDRHRDAARGDERKPGANDDRRRPAECRLHARSRRATCGSSCADLEPAVDRSVRHHLQRRSTSQCAPARSSASPAFPATARRNCWPRSPAKRRSREAARSIICGERAWAVCDPAQRRELGLSFVPEERLGAAPCRRCPSPTTRCSPALRRGHGRARLRAQPRACASIRARDRSRSSTSSAAVTGARAHACPAATCRSSSSAARCGCDPKVMVVAQPTWGVDVGAAQLIRQALIDLRDQRRRGARDLRRARRAVRDLRPARGDRGGPLVAESAAAGSQRRRDRRVDDGGSSRCARRRCACLSCALAAAAGTTRRAVAGDAHRLAADRRGCDAAHRLHAVRALGKDPAAGASRVLHRAGCDAVRHRRAAAEGHAADAVRARARASAFAPTSGTSAPKASSCIGAIAGGGVALVLRGVRSAWFALPVMLLAGALGGMAWAAIPAFLRTRFHTNEILVTLMLVYIAQLLLSYLRARPVARSGGLQLPAVADVRRQRSCCRCCSKARAPTSRSSSRWSLAALVLGLRSKTFAGYRMRVAGLAPAAAAYAGFCEKRNIWLALLIGGGAAGLAGIGEVAGPIGQLQPRSRPATASPRSSWPSSGACIRSASCLRPC